MLVGEAGGQQEHAARRPFVGKAGSVLTAYLQFANLSRSEVFITNIYPFWPGHGNPDPTPEQIAREEWRLYADIDRVKPHVIGAVGRIAAQWFLGDVDMDTVHGVPLPSKRFPGIAIVPIYHPAAGFYDPDLAAYSQQDIFQFSYYLKNPVKHRVKLKQDIEEIAARTFVGGACDTEGLPDKPWGLSWSDGDKSYVVTQKLSKTKFKKRITFHNALHDLVVLRAMGIQTHFMDYDDTMVMAYNLQLEPQSLKALAFRHLGVVMEEFSETVRPHFNEVALKWLKKAALKDYPPSKPEAVEDYAKKRWRTSKPWNAQRRLIAILKSYSEKPNETKLEKKWADLPETHRAQAEWRMRSEFPEFSIFHVPQKKAVHYSGLDALVTAKLRPILYKMIQDKGLERVYEMDRKALQFVDRMQEVGMRVDMTQLYGLEAELETIRDASRRKVQRVVGDRWFNPGSGDQVAKWLYETRGLPIMTYTDKGRGSTKDTALQMLRGYHAKEGTDVATFIDGIQDFREADKYLGTFVLPIFHYAKRDARGDWRLHPNFRVTRVLSGRLSSYDPNVLALPARSQLGKRIRKCFAAREGFIIVAGDASQIELRMMAHHSRDRRMREAFENNEDLHSLTASIIFRQPLSRYVKPMSPEATVERFIAKTINFAVMYGISPRALLEQLYKANIFRFEMENCQHFISEWFEIYASVRIFLQRVWRDAEKNGFVRDMWGRMCYVPNLRVADDELRAAAQRLAGNMPIQGGGHGLVKRGEIRLNDWIENEGLRDQVQPWLQMHDELVLEAEKSLADQVRAKLESVMCADQELISVPLKADTGMGASWGDAK